MAGYCASKAAAHSVTQSLRAELRGRDVEVVGAYPAASTPTCSPADRRQRASPAGGGSGPRSSRFSSASAAGTPGGWS
ncbi:hypothetical protein FAGKG844_100119 [Frankia sp. AgKG'84/4]